MLGQPLQNLRTRVGGIVSDACQFELKDMYLLPSLDSSFSPTRFSVVSEMVRSKIPKLFANALEGAGSNGDSDTEMTDLTNAGKGMSIDDSESAIKREKLVLLTYLSALSSYSGCSAEPHILEFLPVLAHYANDTK